MANKNLFASQRTPIAPVADTVNAAGGKAYSFSSKHALAQIAATNCFNGTYYVSAEDNLKIAKDAAQALIDDPLFLAKTAVYCRDKAYMKDMPAFLTVVLSQIDPKLFRKVFRRVIDNGKMLRNFIQMGRSGAITGKPINMTSWAIKHAIRDWFDRMNGEALFKASIGNDPTMRDILRMARPRPSSEAKAAMFAYLKGAEVRNGKLVTLAKNGEVYVNAQGVCYEHDYSLLPQLVQDYENYKRTKEGTVPRVDFRMLDSLGIGPAEWKQIARTAPWQMTRMNLNTFQRHDVLSDPELVQIIAERLRDKKQIERARVFPYQLLMAFKAATGVPTQISLALQDAMEIAVQNVPKISGEMYVCVDTSGSMSSPATGYRMGASSAVSCVDVAALFAVTMLRTNEQANVIPFDTRTYKHDLNSRDSIMTNAQKLARYGGGGTNCSLPLAELNAKKAKGDLVVFISDNESWVDSGYSYAYGNATGLMTEWQTFKKRNPRAKLVCIDLTPRGSSQVKQHQDILQVGGFSDQVFQVIAGFMEGGDDADHWVKVIENVSLDDASAVPVVEEVVEESAAE